MSRVWAHWSKERGRCAPDEDFSYKSAATFTFHLKKLFKVNILSLLKSSFYHIGSHKISFLRAYNINSPLSSIWLILYLNLAIWLLACIDLDPSQCKSHRGSFHNQL